MYRRSPASRCTALQATRSPYAIAARGECWAIRDSIDPGVAQRRGYPQPRLRRGRRMMRVRFDAMLTGQCDRDVVRGRRRPCALSTQSCRAIWGRNGAMGVRDAGIVRAVQCDRVRPLLFAMAFAAVGCRARCSTRSCPAIAIRNGVHHRRTLRVLSAVAHPQHFLNFFPEPQGQGSLRSGVASRRIGSRGVRASMRWWCRSLSMPGRLAMISSRSL